MNILQRARLFRKNLAAKKIPQPESTVSHSDSSLRESSTPSSSSNVPTTTSLSSFSESQVLDYSALTAPCDYIRSLPSKNVRKKLIDSFNVWFQLPDDVTTGIEKIINDLHNSSLILDDMQDNSSLRRGSPATHCIFGNAQSINSATYMVMNTCLIVQRISPPSLGVIDVLLDGLRELALGQSWELKWKFHLSCPSVQEYMAMIDGKTGAMFVLLVRLMHRFSQHSMPLPEFDRLATLLGRFYQVRDDYLNLQNDSYSEQKGFCEDLDEGKFSYPIISCFNSDPVARDIILGIFRQNGDREGTLTKNTKIYILGLIKRSGAFEATRGLLDRSRQELWAALSGLEESTGQRNLGLRAILTALSVF
jgi:geranylgeranyl pyrophosphate synthase